MYLHFHNYLDSLNALDCIILALVAASEEVRARCHVQHTLLRWPAESCSIAEIISSQSDCAQVGTSYHAGASNQSGAQAVSCFFVICMQSCIIVAHLRSIIK